MIDSETKERIDELEDLVRSQQGPDRAEVCTMMLLVVLLAFIVLLLLFAVFWDRICARIVVDALKYGVEQLPAAN